MDRRLSEGCFVAAVPNNDDIDNLYGHLRLIDILVVVSFLLLPFSYESGVFRSAIPLNSFKIDQVSVLF